MRSHLSRAEITKDALQHTVEAGAETVVAVATILATAVRDLATAMGGFATEVFEIRDAVHRARAANGPTNDPAAGPDPGTDLPV